MADTLVVSGSGKGPISASSIFSLTKPNYDVANAKDKNMKRALYLTKKRLLIGRKSAAAGTADDDEMHEVAAASPAVAVEPPVRPPPPRTHRLVVLTKTVFLRRFFGLT